jgi:hypothetical protein
MEDLRKELVEEFAKLDSPYPDLGPTEEKKIEK